MVTTPRTSTFVTATETVTNSTVTENTSESVIVAVVVSSVIILLLIFGCGVAVFVCLVLGWIKWKNRVSLHVYFKCIQLNTHCYHMREVHGAAIRGFTYYKI